MVSGIQEAYCDEAGIHDGAKVCVIAGYIGDTGAWEAFGNLWSPNLGPGFHAYKFFRRDDKGQRLAPYNGWSDDHANSFLASLLGAIDNTDIRPIAAAVDVSEFCRYTLEQRRTLTGCGWASKTKKRVLTGAPSRPYYLAFMSVVLDAVKLAHGQEIHLIFDEQKQFAGYALRLHAHMKKANESLAARLGVAAFQSRLKAPPLQAADLLAYCYQRKGAGVKLRAQEELAVEWLSKKCPQIKLFGRARLDSLLEQAAPGGRLS